MNPVKTPLLFQIIKALVLECILKLVLSFDLRLQQQSDLHRALSQIVFLELSFGIKIKNCFKKLAKTDYIALVMHNSERSHEKRDTTKMTSQIITPLQSHCQIGTLLLGTLFFTISSC